MTVWQEFRYNAREAAAIMDGWNALEDIANNTTDANYVRDALKLETTGSNRDVFKRVAQGMLLQWYVEGLANADLPRRHLFALRPSAAGIYILAACHAFRKPRSWTDERQAKIEAGAAAYLTARERYMSRK